MDGNGKARVAIDLSGRPAADFSKAKKFPTDHVKGAEFAVRKLRLPALLP